MHRLNPAPYSSSIAEEAAMSEPLIEQLPAWLLAVAVLLLMALATLIGERLRLRYPASLDEDATTKEGYIVSGIVGLLALLLGFTFSLAVDRFESRRGLLLDEANAIHIAFLRAQTLDEPHRTKIDGLLLRYLDNRLALGKLSRGEDFSALLRESNSLQAAMWNESLVAIHNQRDDIMSAYMDSMNRVVETAAARRASREVHVPTAVFIAIFVYMLGTAVVIGYVMGPDRRRAVGALLILTTLSYALILDIDSPTSGTIRESQQPMEEMKAYLTEQPIVRQ